MIVTWLWTICVPIYRWIGSIGQNILHSPFISKIGYDFFFNTYGGNYILGSKVKGHLDYFGLGHLVLKLIGKFMVFSMFEKVFDINFVWDQWDRRNSNIFIYLELYVLFFDFLLTPWSQLLICIDFTIILMFLLCSDYIIYCFLEVRTGVILGSVGVS